MATMLDYLQGFKPLPKETIKDLQQAIKVKDIYKMHMLLGVDDVSNAYAFIEKGLLKRFYLLGDNTEVCTGFIKEDHWFTSKSFFDQKSSSEIIQAIEDSQVHYLTVKDYNNLCKKHIELNKTLRIILEDLTLEVTSRTDHFRISSYERYSNILRDTPDLLIRVSSTDLCSYLEVDEKTLQGFKYGNKQMS